MSPRKRPLTDLCGGRYAFMPAAACEDSDLPNGAFRLYAILCGRAKPKGACEVRLKSIAKKLGVSARTIQKWKCELELLGWIEQLHQGDKAIGKFRVIRDPSERAAVRLTNTFKVGTRSAIKTPHATKTSHPRCEESDAHNKIESRTPCNPPAEPTAHRPSSALDPKEARQGKAAATGSGSKPFTSSQPNPKAPSRQPDWQSWFRWVEATRPMNKEEASLWIMGEIDRLREEHGVDSEEAGWMLHRRLRSEKESGE